MIRQKLPSEINILKVLFPTVSVLIFFLIFFSIRNVPEAEYLNKSSPPINKFSSVDIKNGEIYGLTQDKDSFTLQVQIFFTPIYQEMKIIT